MVNLGPSFSAQVRTTSTKADTSTPWMFDHIPTRSFLCSLGVVAYVALVATLMQNAESLFGSMNTVLAATAFLLLFSVSAAVVGSLVFGYPAVLFLGGKRREGLMAAALTIGFLVVETVFVLTIVAVAS